MAVNSVLKGARWRVQHRRHVDGQWHINRLEVRAGVQGVQMQCLKARRRRQLYLLDSRVAMGVLAKGRSAAPALNRDGLW